MQLISFSISIASISKTIKEKRVKILNRILINAKARLIQRAYRRYLKAPGGKNHILVASTSLLFYRSCLFKFAKRISLTKIVKFASTSAHANLLVHQIGNYGIKILRIQKGYKRYLIKKKFKIKHLSIKNFC